LARALGGLPQLAAALARGELSYSKVRALTRVATPETEARLLAVGRAGTAVHVERIVRGWRVVDRQVENQAEAARHRGRGLQVYTDADGMVVVRGRLTPGAGAVLVRALESARETLYAQCRTVGAAAEGPVADPPTYGQQQADALVLVAETALEHGLAARGASGTRSWCTWMRRRWPTPPSRGSRCWRTARTFPRKRHGGWL
jgi:hypothetical protein